MIIVQTDINPSLGKSTIMQLANITILLQVTMDTLVITTIVQQQIAMGMTTPNTINTTIKINTIKAKIQSKMIPTSMHTKKRPKSITNFMKTLMLKRSALKRSTKKVSKKWIRISWTKLMRPTWFYSNSFLENKFVIY